MIRKRQAIQTPPDSSSNHLLLTTIRTRGAFLCVYVQVNSTRVLEELEADDDSGLAHDASTNALIRRYRALRA